MENTPSPPSFSPTTPHTHTHTHTERERERDGERNEVCTRDEYLPFGTNAVHQDDGAVGGVVPALCLFTHIRYTRCKCYHAVSQQGTNTRCKFYHAVSQCVSVHGLYRNTPDVKTHPVNRKCGFNALQGLTANSYIHGRKAAYTYCHCE